MKAEELAEIREWHRVCPARGGSAHIGALLAEVDRLRERVAALHTEALLAMFFDGDCATDDCDHDGEPCPTYPLQVCAHCNRIAEDAISYGGLGSVPKSAHWPCPTMQAIGVLA